MDLRYGLKAGVILGLLAATAAADDETTAEERAASLMRMRQIADAIVVYSSPDRSAGETKRLSEPVLRYTDPTRRQHDCSLWIWGEHGRPSAIVAVELYPANPPQRRSLYEVASLSTDRIVLKIGGQSEWTARDAGCKFERIAMADAVTDRPALRLVQMKELQRRFTAHEQGTVDGRIELRPVPKPLHRYQDSVAGLIDGAVLSFANGTNPEVLLVLEARQAGGWHYALVQMTGGEVAVELDGKEIWRRGQADPPSVRDAYINGWLPSDWLK